MGGKPEPTTQPEEIGWLHHLWDEVGPQLVTVAGLVIVAVLGLIGIIYKVRHHGRQ